MTVSELKSLTALHQKKHRYLSRTFLIEGFHLVEEILKSKVYSRSVRKIFTTNDFENEKISSQLVKRSIAHEIITRKNLERLAESKSPQNIIALAEMPGNVSLETGKPVIALDNINDPGNLGTLIRTAYWFGIYNIIVTQDSADIYNAKVLRASQGAVFHTKITVTKNLYGELQKMSKNGYEIYVSDLSAKKDLTELKFSELSIFVFGNESHGVNNDILSDKNFSTFRIKPFSECESLNVASAAAVTLFEYRKKF